MKEGKVHASGSPLFLKDRFGLGYNLTVVIEPDVGGKEYPIENLQSFLQQYVPECKVTRVFGKEVTFRLPKGYESTFPAAFKALEADRCKYGVGAFGVENSSLEEVFLLLAEEKGIELGNFSTSLPNHRNAVSDIPCEAEENIGDLSSLIPLSFGKQIGLMYWKRYIIQRRDPAGVFWSVMVPLLVVALVLLILTIDIPLAGPAIVLSPALLSKGSKPAKSDFLVGGGDALDNASASYETVASRSENLRAFLGERYPNLKYVDLDNIDSSTVMSNFILDTINDNDHNTRYGAFVFEDLVNTTVRVDWEVMKDDIPVLLNSSEAQAWLDQQTTESMNDLVSMLFNPNIQSNSSVRAKFALYFSYSTVQFLD